MAFTKKVKKHVDGKVPKPKKDSFDTVATKVGQQLVKSEIKKHPFPRSTDSIKSLATLRGSQAGFKFAEAFKIIFSKE